MYLDAHVHLRDFEENYKETIRHGLEVARDSGLDAVFDMPNTKPATTTKKQVMDRLRLARQANVPEVFYGVYLGLTKDIEQIKEAVEVCQTTKQAVGMKLYAGRSVGDLAVIEKEDQHTIYQTLATQGYKGVLVVHCEKESHMHPTLWNPQNPITHCFVRDKEAEVTSVADQIELATQTKFQGKLHFTHISTPGAVEKTIEAKEQGLDVSLGVCPHHLLFDYNQMTKEQGILWKMNPPLRSPQAREELVEYLRSGAIDWIETDHAPHSLDEKLKEPYCSGIPGLAWWPLFAEFLRREEFSEDLIHQVTFSRAAKRFGLDITPKKRIITDRRADYAFDPYTALAKNSGWKS